MAEHKITSGGKDYVPQAVDLLSKVFTTDPVITYVLGTLTPEKRLSFVPKFFRAFLTAAALNHASFEEVDDWASCSVMIPPGYRVDNYFTLYPAGLLSLCWSVGMVGCSRMLEYFPLGDAAKAKTLQPGEKYYYLFFIGTRLDSRRQGLSSALIQHYQRIATAENTPIWLEATTAYSKSVYANLGFETVDRMVLGKGVVKADGTAMKGGEGVEFWGMIWRP